jgi:DNA-binding NarL/FixJ family response regulator
LRWGGGVAAALAAVPRPREALYLDTTYADARYAFPPQAAVLEAVAALVKHLLVRARSTPALAGVAWVFLTRDSRKESIARGFELGASDYVLKPAPAAVLAAPALRRCCRNAAAVASAAAPGGRHQRRAPHARGAPARHAERPARDQARQGLGARESGR